MKKFRTKKKHLLFKTIFLFIIIIISFYTVLKFMLSGFNNININNTKFIKYLISEGFNNQIINFSYPDIIDITKPLDLVQRNLDFNVSNNYLIDTIKEENSNILEPLVYIYNTHDLENYKYTKYQSYNIIPSVKMASLILKEKLDDLGLYSIVEDSSISNILKENNWNYSNSYNASRLLIEKKILEYPSLKYFIDIHRDSSNYLKTNLNYNNKDFAKLMFVVGVDNPKYSDNLKMSLDLNNLINEKIDGLSRGVLKKGGDNVNGIYNQDISSKSILIEIGGVDNNISEVNNSINILSDILYTYIKGDNNEKEKI